MTYSLEQWFGAAQARQAEIERELGELRGLRERHDGERAALEQQRGQALDDISKAILPSLEPADIQRAVRLTGYLPLVNDSPVAQREAERSSLERRLAEIEADPLYRDRELLRAPRVGQLTRQVDELVEFRAPFIDIINKAQHERRQRLLDVGYGTPDYSVGFWRLSYYRDWKAGDEILERFPDKKSFAEVREEYLQAVDTTRVYDDKLAELREEIGRGEQLEEEHEAKQQALDTLADRHVASWRARLNDHLLALEPGALGDRLAAEPDLQLLYTRAVGINKKIEYLGQVLHTEVGELEAQLRVERDKLNQDMAKNRRPKRAWTTFDEASFHKRFRERPAKRTRRWQSVRSTYDTVSSFDRYDRGRLVEDFLWWDLMTDGRLDGDFIPEVRSWRDAHPGARYTRDDDDAAAAAAVAATDAVEPTSSFDAS